MKNSFRNIIKLSNSLDSDQARHFVGPGLGPNCLQRLSADDTSRLGVELHKSNDVMKWTVDLDILPLSFLYLFAFWVIFQAFLPSADFFSKLFFSRNSFRNTIRVSNGLVPDQDRSFVGPDLGPNCLQSYQQTTVSASKERAKQQLITYDHKCFFEKRSTLPATKCVDLV